MKCYKPNPQFYKSILEDNGLLPQEFLFVGDSITDDVLGPKAIGMKMAWIDRNGMGGEVGQDYTIVDLSGLMSAVRKGWIKKALRLA